MTRTSLSPIAQPIGRRPRGALLIAVAALCACGSAATLPVSAGMGPHPELPAPKKSLIPTVNVADAKGWRGDAKPKPASGLGVNAYATGLDHPRWLYVLPNGDVLVAETNAPVRPEDGKGIKGWFFKKFQKKAGAGVPDLAVRHGARWQYALHRQCRCYRKRSVHDRRHAHR